MTIVSCCISDVNKYRECEENEIQENLVNWCFDFDKSIDRLIGDDIKKQGFLSQNNGNLKLNYQSALSNASNSQSKKQNPVVNKTSASPNKETQLALLEQEMTSTENLDANNISNFSNDTKINKSGNKRRENNNSKSRLDSELVTLNNSNNDPIIKINSKSTAKTRQKKRNYKKNNADTQEPSPSDFLGNKRKNLNQNILSSVSEEENAINQVNLLSKKNKINSNGDLINNEALPKSDEEITNIKILLVNSSKEQKSSIFSSSLVMLN